MERTPFNVYLRLTHCHSHD